MRRVICAYLLSVSLVANSVICWQVAPFDEPSDGSNHSDSLTATTPYEPAPTGGQNSVGAGSGQAPHFLLRENEGRPLVTARAPTLDRASETARSSLHPRGERTVAELLWAHTCGVCLPKRHVRLQV